MEILANHARRCLRFLERLELCTHVCQRNRWLLQRSVDLPIRIAKRAAVMASGAGRASIGRGGSLVGAPELTQFRDVKTASHVQNSFCIFRTSAI